MPSVQANPRTCLKCGYQRRPEDAGPQEACPSCGAVYAKVEAARLKDEANAAPLPDARPVTAAQVGAVLTSYAPEYIDAGRRQMTHLIYFLYLLPLGLSALLAYVMARSIKDDYDDEIAVAHNEWQYDTLSKLVWVVAAVLLMALVLGAAQSGYWLTHDESLHHFAQRGAKALIVCAGALYVWTLLRTLRGWFQLLRGEGP